MAKARVEFVTLGIGPNYNARHQNVIDQLLASAAVLDVGPAPTAAGSRPTAPAGDLVHARITATTGKVIAAWGVDPTASQANGLVVVEGGERGRSGCRGRQDLAGRAVGGLSRPTDRQAQGHDARRTGCRARRGGPR